MEIDNNNADMVCTWDNSMIHILTWANEIASHPITLGTAAIISDCSTTQQHNNASEKVEATK